MILDRGIQWITMLLLGGTLELKAVMQLMPGFGDKT